jgi:hypothetical protein
VSDLAAFELMPADFFCRRQDCRIAIVPNAAGKCAPVAARVEISFSRRDAVVPALGGDRQQQPDAPSCLSQLRMRKASERGSGYDPG